MDNSPLQKARHAYAPKIPKILASDVRKIGAKLGGATEASTDQAELRRSSRKPTACPSSSSSPETIRRPASDGRSASSSPAARPPAATTSSPASSTASRRATPPPSSIGFLGGPWRPRRRQVRWRSTPSSSTDYRNTGGFDIIGSGRTKIETAEQFETAPRDRRRRCNLDAIVVIGGDDSNTNAALLAEYFIGQGRCPSPVIGVPKTIDGDLKNEPIETSFGFDTATKIYSELIGNIGRDANSRQQVLALHQAHGPLGVATSPSSAPSRPSPTSASSPRRSRRRR